MTTKDRSKREPEGTARPRRRWRGPKRSNEVLTAYLFLSPALLLAGLFIFYPMANTVYQSFTDYRIAQGGGEWVGSLNYKRLACRVRLSTGEARRCVFARDSQPTVQAEPPFLNFEIDKGIAFLPAMMGTLTYTFLNVPLQTALALYLALIINSRLPGRGALRTIFFSPVILSAVAGGIVFSLMFRTSGGLLGLFPAWLQNFGIGFPDWQINDPEWAMPVILLMTFWKYTGTPMIVFLGGLQTIDRTYYEAAAIDGIRAGWQTFRHITWPLLRPATFFVVVTSVIYSLRVFEQMYVMTPGGGPTRSTYTAVYFIFDNFDRNTGLAAAAASVLLTLAVIMTAVQVRFGEAQS